MMPPRILPPNPLCPRCALIQVDYSNHAFRRVDISTGVVTTVAGNPGPSNSGFNDGVGTAARFHIPIGAAMDKHGTVVIVVSGALAGADLENRTGSTRHWHWPPVAPLK